MTEIEIIEATREALWTTLIVSGPLLAIALIVGLGIGFLQALTQIQEMTISFIPKIVAVIIGTALLLPFMVGTMTAYATNLLGVLPALK